MFSGRIESEHWWPETGQILICFVAVFISANLKSLS